MNKNHPILRGRILFQRDQETERFVLRWTRLGVNDAIKSWGPPSTDFPSAVEAIAYGKNLALKHLTEKGLAEAVEKVEWWIKGDDTYYCPGCLSPLEHAAQYKRSGIPQDVPHLKCDQCQTVVNIPANAFAFDNASQHIKKTVFEETARVQLCIDGFEHNIVIVTLLHLLRRKELPTPRVSD